jgi:hypothetical protein
LEGPSPATARRLGWYTHHVETDGDSDGCAFWKRILEAVAELTRTKPAESERVN